MYAAMIDCSDATLLWGTILEATLSKQQTEFNSFSGIKSMSQEI